MKGINNFCARNRYEGWQLTPEKAIYALKCTGLVINALGWPCFLHTQTSGFCQPIDVAAVSLPGDPQRNPEQSQTPNYDPGGLGETGSFHQNAQSESPLTWGLRGSGRSCQKQHGSGHGISEQSPFLLGESEFPRSDRCTPAPVFPQRLSKLPLRVSSPSSVLQRTISVPDLTRAASPGCPFQTGNALGFRHWLITNVALLFGLEIHLYLIKQ